MRDSLAHLATELGIREQSLQLLEQAFTHPSYLGETSGAVSYERLEYLGDAVLGAVIAEYLFARFPDQPEGFLSRAKSIVVSEPTLAIAARELQLGDLIRLSLGEQTSASSDRDSVLSDVFEALTAVVYIDRGFDAARTMILRSLGGILAELERSEFARDAKSSLQEMMQAQHKITPEYVVVCEDGADHDKTFTVEVRLRDAVMGRGMGKSKKSAQQSAAQAALNALSPTDDSD